MVNKSFGTTKEEIQLLDTRVSLRLRVNKMSVLGCDSGAPIPSPFPHSLCVLYVGETAVDVVADADEAASGVVHLVFVGQSGVGVV